jgi:hypothetical protein
MPFISAAKMSCNDSREVAGLRRFCKNFPMQPHFCLVAVRRQFTTLNKPDYELLTVDKAENHR